SSTTFTTTAAQPVSGVSGPAGASTTAAGASRVQYQGPLAFTVSATGTLLANAGGITTTGPAGMGLGSARVHDDTTNVDVGSGCCGNMVDVRMSATVNPGDHLTVNFTGVTNPPVGTYSLA